MTPKPGRISQREFLDSIEGVFTERSLWVDGLWMIGVLVGLAGVFVFAYWIQRRNWAKKVNNPRKLFRSVLRGLKLPVPQNDAIIRICRESGVEHPISLLICRDLFRRHASTWMDNLERTHGSSARRNAASRVSKAEAALFSWIDQPEIPGESSFLAPAREVIVPRQQQPENHSDSPIPNPPQRVE